MIFVATSCEEWVAKVGTGLFTRVRGRGILRSSPLARLSGIMLATVRDELQSRVGQQGGWRHDENGVNSGLDSAGRGVVRHPPDPVRTKDPAGGVRVLEVRSDADPVLGHPDRVVLVRHGADRKER